MQIGLRKRYAPNDRSAVQQRADRNATSRCNGKGQIYQHGSAACVRRGGVGGGWYKGERRGANRARECTPWKRETAVLAARGCQHRESLVQRRHRAVCDATILIRRWIYGLNHRRIISDSRALLPPTETYACLFADNCT